MCRLFGLGVYLELAKRPMTSKGVRDMGRVYYFLALFAHRRILTPHELADRLSAASVFRAAGYGAEAMLAGMGLVAASYVAQPENPLWEFILRYPGNPLALITGAWFACMPLAVALAAVLVTRVERATAPGHADWSGLGIGE
jgi:hypothetical protein